MKSPTLAIAAISGILALLTPSSPGRAENKLDQVIVLKGHCTEALAIPENGGKPNDMVNGCQSLLSTRYVDGRQGFYLTSGKVTVTFSGKRTIDTKDGFIQEVDGMIYGVQGKTEGMVDAVGTCEVKGNPFAGEAYIHCEAQTNERKVYFSFTSDGSKPVVKRMP